MIDKGGKIYQTARVDKQTNHVGALRSECLEEKNCVIPKGKRVSVESQIKGVKPLHRYEQKKEYPARYPSNLDSIGIEMVGEYDKDSIYVQPTCEQAKSVAYLIEALQNAGVVRVTDADIYVHPQVSRKNETEAIKIWDTVKACNMSLLGQVKSVNKVKEK